MSGEKKKGKLTKTKITVIAVIIFVLVYFAWLFYGANFSMIHTETAVLKQVSDSIYTDGYVIRNETLITNDNDGVVSYLSDNGEKVAAGGVIARVYKSENDATAHKRMENIDDQINELNKITLQSQASQTALDSINKQLISSLNLTLSDANANKFYKISDDKDSLSYFINERLLITGKVPNFDDKIAALNEEKETLAATAEDPIAEITSPVAGYFISYTDGYEGQYDYSKAKDITQGDLDSALKASKDDVGKDVIGKVISGLNWYIACPVTADEALQINTNSETVSVNMPFATTEAIPVSVSAINQQSKTSDGVLVLQCKYMSPELSYLRNETVRIDVKTYKGIRVSKDSIHDREVEITSEDENGNSVTETQKVRGVYVQYGNEITFKQISIIYAGDDYVLCDSNPDVSDFYNNQTIKLYDSVVTEGDVSRVQTTK